MNKFAVAMLTCCFYLECEAAVITDGTVGTATTLIGPNFNIAASLGTRSGSNLFHSFSAFGLTTGESALFMDPGVSNIIARVTGGSASNIDGMLATSVGSVANLYLLNPSGIIFGANASLNVGGAFTATTANYVRLADGNTFDASTPSNSILTAAAPAAFGFLGANIAPIQSQAWLSVPDGQTLALIGGDVTATGDMTALGGKINIASVASAGEVVLTPSLDVSGFASLGSVLVNSRVDVSENLNSLSSVQSGSIYIQGGTIVVGPSGGLYSNTFSTAGGGIALAARDGLTMQGILSTTTFGGGTGGNINLDANAMLLDFAYIFADTQGGNAGAVNINANQLSVVNGSWVSSDARLGSTGIGGSVNVNVTGALAMANSKVTTLANGSGNGGSIALNAASIILDKSKVSANTHGFGNAGSVLVNAGQLDILNSSTLSSDTYGMGNGGDITLNASRAALNFGGVFADTYDVGNAGRVVINASQLDVLNASWVSSDGIKASMGNAGRVNLNIANRLAVSGLSQISSVANGLGNGGDIVIKAGAMTLDHSKIYADSTLLGNAGSVTINANQLDVLNGSQVSSFSQSLGNAGAININVKGLFTASNSSFLSSAYWGGNGGPITLSADRMLLDNSIVRADTLDVGNAGFVTISANQLDVLNGSIISSSSTWLGNAGDINVKVTGALTARNGSFSSVASGGGNSGNINFSATSMLLDKTTVYADTSDVGNAGTVKLNASQMAIVNGSWVSSDTLGAIGGNAGSVSLNAAGLLTVSGSKITSETWGTGSGGSLNINAGSAIFNNSTVYADTRATGNAGAVNINAAGLDILNGSWISSDTLGGSGNAGNLNVSVAQSMLLRGGSQITTESRGVGRAGTIVIQTGASLGMSDSMMSSASRGAGRAGDIVINAGNALRMDNSAISTQADIADGGNISILAKDLIYANNATISATVMSGFGGGGNIFLDPTFIVLNNSAIIANAFGGPGGNINLVANNFIPSSNSIVSASSQLGVSGTVTVTSQFTDLSGGLLGLQANYLDATGLLRAPCAAKNAEKTSSFLQLGRGGIPSSPEDFISSSLIESVLSGSVQYAGSSASGCA